MFIANLRNYIFRENERRRRDDRISLLIAFSFSMLMLFVFGQSERDAAIEGLVVLGISMLSLTLYFCSNGPKILADLRQGLRSTRVLLYRPVNRRIAAISAVVLLLLFPLLEIEALALNRKLLRLTSDSALSPQRCLIGATSALIALSPRWE